MIKQKRKKKIAQSARSGGGVEYADCFSAEG